MNCSSGEIRNISIEHEKFNLTASNPGLINLSAFQSKYVNLTSSPIVKKFDLDYRKNDYVNEANKSTYWRIYVPVGITGELSRKYSFWCCTSTRRLNEK